MQYKCQNSPFSKGLTQAHSLVLIDPMIESYSVQPLRVRVNLGTMAIKGNLHSPKLQHYWILAIRLLVSYRGQSLEESYLYARMQSVDSTTPADDI